MHTGTNTWDETSAKIIALCEFLRANGNPLAQIVDVQESGYDDSLFVCPDGDFLVVSEDERDDRWDDSLESYLEECIYDQLPENLVGYFDSEKWKRDARFDGAGVCLAPYDHEEHEHGNYYIYRVN